MLTLSAQAAELIRRLVVADTSLPQTAGLRLDTDDLKHALVMHLVARPRPGDAVLASHGAALFVSPMAAARVSTQTLNAQTEGRRSFYLD